MSELEIAAIEARLKDATPGPWGAIPGDYPDDWPVAVPTREAWLGGCPDCGVRPGFDQADAEFIAHAPTDIAALLAHVKEQAAEIERLNGYIVKQGYDPRRDCLVIHVNNPTPGVDDMIGGGDDD